MADFVKELVELNGGLFGLFLKYIAIAAGIVVGVRYGWQIVLPWWLP